MSSRPEVSVVVPTRDSVELLRRCLASLGSAAQAVSIEAIVVDQESSDGTPEAAAAGGATVVETSRPSLYAPPTRSRNLGAGAAQGEFLLHLDADMTLARGVLDVAVARCRDEGHVALTFGEVDVYDGFWAASKALERRAYHESSLEGARFVRSAVFHEVGGYDESLGSGEDWDIHVRYARHGTIGRVPDAVQHHLGSINYRSQLSKKFKYGQSASSFLAKHDSSEFSRSMLAAYARSWRSFARDPLHAAGFVALRAGEAAAVGAGVAVARRRARQRT